MDTDMNKDNYEMGERIKKLKCTEQGVGSPVPVGVASERAGSPRPSSSDCLSPMVDNQASGQAPATGGSEAKSDEVFTEILDPFKRRSSLVRSPPRERVSTPGVTDKKVVDLTGELPKEAIPGRIVAEVQRERSASVDTGKKRKMGETSFTEDEHMKRIEDRTASVMKEAIEYITKTVSELGKRIDENPNTKREIKELAGRLKKGADVLNRKSSRDWLESKKWKPVDTESKSETKDMSTQTEEVEEDQRRGDTRGTEIERIINEEDTWKSLTKVIDERWPERLFKITSVEGENTKEVWKAEIITVILNPKKERETGIVRKVLDRHPEIEELLDAGWEGENLEKIEKETKTKMKGRDRESWNQTIYVIPYDINENGVNNLEELWTQLQRHRKCMEEGNSKKMTVIAGDGVKTGYLRKIIEHVYRGSLEKCKVVRGERWGTKIKGRGKESAIIMKPAGDGKADFAKAVKEMKKKLDTVKLGVKIKNVKEKESGEVIVDLVETRKGGSLAFKEEINTKYSRQVKTEERRVSIEMIVTGIDKETTESEVVEAIKEQAGVEEEDVRLTAFTEAKIGGKRIAFINLYNKMAANRVIAREEMRIGWWICKVKENIKAMRCNKCQKLGHYARECGDPNEDRKCYRCGEKGHRIKECGKEEKCGDCEEKGHRMGTMLCPEYRKCGGRLG